MRLSCNDYLLHFILKVRSANCCTLNCSALLSNNLSCSTEASNNPFTAFLNVLRRWLNAVFTKRKKSFSLLIVNGFAFGSRRITPLFTLGGGVKHLSLTSNKYSASKKA